MTTNQRAVDPYRSRGLVSVDEHDALRQGSYVLVPRRDASFPDRCIHCNAPADAYRKQHTLRFGSRWIPKVFRPKVSVELPLCARHRRRDARGQLLTSLSPAVALLSVFGLFFSVWLGAAGLLLALAAMMIGHLLKGFGLVGTTGTPGMIRIRAGRAFLSSIPSLEENRAVGSSEEN